jgi:hypothetical protein
VAQPWDPLPSRAVAEALAPPPRSPVAAGLAHAFGSWKAILLLVALQIALAATVVLPWHARVAGHLDHHAHAAALGGAPDAHDRAFGWVDAGLARGVLQEIAQVETTVLGTLERALVVVVLLAWVAGAFAAGGFLGTGFQRDPAATSLRAFLAEGGRWLVPMLRVGLVFGVLLLGGWRAILEVWAGLASAAEEAATSSRTAWWGERAREASAVGLFFWLRVAADSARADLVRGRRRSAWIGVLVGLTLPLRHPLTTLALAAPVALLAVAVPYGIGLLLPELLAPHAVGHLTCFLVLQVAVGACWLARATWLGGLTVLRA